ncbi:MAG TPA: FkbM family methyltransferase [Actinomycetota bacterium]|jgi:FkbM family methyltransferase|nr:FkbM family methyltransferase [Actinomycetota bacterium]
MTAGDVQEDIHKRVGLVGRLFTLSGSARDEYFRGLPEGEYPDPVLSSLRPYVDDRAVCIDVGANIGLYSLALSILAPNGRIYAFEPSNDGFHFLQKNLAQNQVKNVIVSQMALGSSNQSLRFHEIPFFTAGSFATDDSCFLTSEILGSNYFEAPCTTLDEFVRSSGIDHIDLVKIDVEGAEMAVIEGALETLEKFQPLVVLEFSSFALTLHLSTLPQVALEKLQKVFPFLYVIGREDGRLMRLETGVQMYDFLYDNGIYGPVDNLLGSFTDLDIPRGYVRLAVLAAEARAAGEAAAKATLEAVEPTAGLRPAIPPPLSASPAPVGLIIDAAKKTARKIGRRLATALQTRN